MRFVHVTPGQSLVSKLWSIIFQSAGLLINVPGKTTNAPVIHKTQSSFLSHSAFKTGVWGAQQWLATNNSFNLGSKLARFCSALIMFLTQWRPILNWFIRRTDVVWVVSCIKAYPRQVYISFFYGCVARGQNVCCLWRTRLRGMIDHLQPKGHESGMFAPDKKIIHPFEEKKYFRPNIFWVLKVEIKKFENDVRLFFSHCKSIQSFHSHELSSSSSSSSSLSLLSSSSSSSALSSPLSAWNYSQN